MYSSNVLYFSSIVVPCVLNILQEISSIRTFVPQDLRDQRNRASAERTLKDLKKKFPDGFPRLDPIEDMKVKDASFSQLVRKIESLEDSLRNHALHKDPTTEEKI